MSQVGNILTDLRIRLWSIHFHNIKLCVIDMPEIYSTVIMVNVVKLRHWVEKWRFIVSCPRALSYLYKRALFVQIYSTRWWFPIKISIEITSISASKERKRFLSTLRHANIIKSNTVTDSHNNISKLINVTIIFN